jgi:hypothetical protein
MIRKPYSEVAHFSVEKPAQFSVETNSQSNILLSYIINMAMIEASTGAANRKNEGEKGDASAA